MGALHPAILPFAIGLLLFGVLCDAAAVVARRESFAQAGYLNLLGGSLGALLAAITGWRAAASLSLGPSATALLAIHRALGIAAVVVFVPLALWRLALKGKLPRLGQTLYLTLAFAGAAVLLATAALGEIAVYQHGAGVRPAVESVSRK